MDSEALDGVAMSLDFEPISSDPVDAGEWGVEFLAGVSTMPDR